MREILFRGKRKSDGKWLFGNLLKHNSCAGIYGINTLNECGRVDPETVGQYTGLCDKNGNKVFEGDILDCGDRVVRVTWHPYCGSWDCEFICYKGDRRSNGIQNVEWKYRAEVVGNIYDSVESAVIM